MKVRRSNGSGAARPLEDALSRNPFEGSTLSCASMPARMARKGSPASSWHHHAARSAVRVKRPARSAARSAVR
eukprot:922844-Prorocentrum_minimum.AAC.1